MHDRELVRIDRGGARQKAERCQRRVVRRIPGKVQCFEPGAGR
jgi:hypothetical protein